MHSKNNIKKIVNYYVLALIPLILYGFYKNGLIPFMNYKHNYYLLIKPLLVPGIGFIMGYLLDKYIFKEDSNKSFTPYITTISGMILPMNANLLIYIILLIIITLITHKWLKKVNGAIVIKLLMILYILIFSKYTYLNNYELNSKIHYNLNNLLFGRGSGGIATTSVILSVISYLFLSNFTIYKKDIPIIIIVAYLLSSLIFIPIYGINDVVINIFRSSLFFTSIFIATIPSFSPISKKGRLIYGLIIGIGGSILVNTLLPYEGIYLILLIMPLIMFIIKKIFKINN